MSVIVEFTVPADEFALYETLSTTPGMVVEIERVVAHGPERIMPYFWTRIEGEGVDHERFEEAAADDSSIEDLDRLDERDEMRLYRAKWVGDVETVVYAYTETGATLLTATGRNEQWELQLRFDDESAVTRFSTYVNEEGLAVDLNRVYQPSQPAPEPQELTDVQREAIMAGLETGYYEIPRETTTTELADSIGISQQALAQRFRRAHRTLAENALKGTPPRDEHDR